MATTIKCAQTLKWVGNGLTFTLCNMTAAALVGVSLFSEFNLSAALIQASYLFIGFIGVFRWMFRRATSGAAKFGEDMS
ncbi:MAG: CBU_0592 family membrane protein [Marinosulfonomonas sp.]